LLSALAGFLGQKKQNKKTTSIPQSIDVDDDDGGCMAI
tara:strand:- start:229 stop:342 length:114 start_codon:yes stop_codon:yes gene_type:complete